MMAVGMRSIYAGSWILLPQKSLGMVDAGYKGMFFLHDSLDFTAETGANDSQINP